MIGKTISHYKILEKLGEGGMGVVYKAEDTKLKRIVALKFLPPELTRDSEAKKRFIHEAQAASALQHTNICNIHDIDESPDGQIYIVMDCYEGETLKEKIQHGPLKIEEAVNITIQAAQGLEKAHKKGIIHRDIKPANIFITKDGNIKIMDFGLAKLIGQSRLTKTGSTLGTVAYMSPEQARGEKVDYKTDIWSLGVVLYEMITGQHPFRGDYDQAVLYSILNNDPEPPTSLRTGVPMDMERTIIKMMAKDKSCRYQHMDDLIVDLSHSKNNLINQGTTQPITGKQVPDKKKKLRVSYFIYLIILFGIVVAVVIMLSKIFSHHLPIVVLMDSPHPERVYDPETRKNKGTNADDITDILRDLQLELHKETTSSMWHREDQVLRQDPDLIVIHRSCFYDATNLADSSFMIELYDLMESRLVLFLGYIGLGNSNTKFLVYSRSFSADQSKWIAAAEERFPPLKGRIYTMFVPGGRDSATFRNPETANTFKLKIKDIIGIK